MIFSVARPEGARQVLAWSKAIHATTLRDARHESRLHSLSVDRRSIAVTHSGGATACSFAADDSLGVRWFWLMDLLDPKS